MSASARKTLVTGGCGFIGAHLCAHLVQRGEDVVVVDDLSVGSRRNLDAAGAEDIAVESVDICDRDSVSRLLRARRPERVIHLAAVHFIPSCEAEPVKAIRTNVEGTQALLEACAAASVQSFLLASSGAVYEPGQDAHRESDPLGPTDVYGHTKRWAEELARLFHSRTGVGVGIARIFNTFGPGETNPHFIPSVISQLLRGDPVRVGNLSSRRDYVYVGDVVSAIARLADVSRDRGLLTCNIGRGEAVEGSRIVELVSRALGRDAEIVVDPRRLRSDDRPVLVSDCRLARSELGWEPKTGLEEGLEAAIEYPLGDSTMVSG